MLEISEARTIARQLNETVRGRRITRAAAAYSPHGFAWYFGDPAVYGDLLEGREITTTAAFGGFVEIWADDMRVALGDGVNTRYLPPDAKRPAKHQLMLDLDDGGGVYCTVQMYGGIWAFPDGMKDDFYYTNAKERPSPLSEAFDAAYFAALMAEDTAKLSAKAFLATQQRVPGLGNGVLQDILWNAKIHPKRAMSTLTDSEIEGMFRAVKGVLTDMTDKGGRDTEKDLFGHAGGYRTVLSRKTNGTACPDCGGTINRMAYLGGNVYVCEGCQRL